MKDCIGTDSPTPEIKLRNDHLSFSWARPGIFSQNILELMDMKEVCTGYPCRRARSGSAQKLFSQIPQRWGLVKRPTLVLWKSITKELKRIIWDKLHTKMYSVIESISGGERFSSCFYSSSPSTPLRCLCSSEFCNSGNLSHLAISIFALIFFLELSAAHNSHITLSHWPLSKWLQLLWLYLVNTYTQNLST